MFLFSICVLISFQSSPKKSIKSETIQSVLWLALFSCSAVNSLGSLQWFSTYFRKLKENWSLTAHISRQSFFLWLWWNWRSFVTKSKKKSKFDRRKNQLAYLKFRLPHWLLFDTILFSIGQCISYHVFINNFNFSFNIFHKQ